VIRIVGEIRAIETIAEGAGIRELAVLREQYGQGFWRKKKGIAQIDMGDGRSGLAEVHWYEAHGIGKVKLKVKRWLDS
jgi:hypothetical protein